MFALRRAEGARVAMMAAAAVCALAACVEPRERPAGEGQHQAGWDDPKSKGFHALWFREQAVTLHEGRVVLADAETIAARRADPGYGSIGRLLAQANVEVTGVDLDVIDAANAAQYFSRDERHDFAV